MVHCNTCIHVSSFVKVFYLHEFMAAGNVDCQFRFTDNFLVDYSKLFGAVGTDSSWVLLVCFVLVFLFIMS